MRAARKEQDRSTTELLEDLLIVTLGLNDIPQRAIRDIVGCDINRVNNIVKHLKRQQRRRKGGPSDEATD